MDRNIVVPRSFYAGGAGRSGAPELHDKMWRIGNKNKKEKKEKKSRWKRILTLKGEDLLCRCCCAQVGIAPCWYYCNSYCNNEDKKDISTCCVECCLSMSLWYVGYTWWTFFCPKKYNSWDLGCAYVTVPWKPDITTEEMKLEIGKRNKPKEKKKKKRGLLPKSNKIFPEPPQQQRQPYDDDAEGPPTRDYDDDGEDDYDEGGYSYGDEGGDYYDDEAP